MPAHSRTNKRTIPNAVLSIAAMTACGGLAAHAIADELFVPSADYPTIQAALDAVVAGDEIVLRAGVFSGAGNEALTGPRVVFTIRGESGDPADVVLRGPGDPYERVVHAMDFLAGPTGTLVRVEDLTVEGFTGVDGGAIRVTGANLEFDNCVFQGNGAGNMGCFSSGYGGAFYIRSGDLRFVDCVIRNNYAFDEVCSGHGGTGAGGGIYSRSGGVLVFERCLIESNRAGGNGGGSGAGVSAQSSTVTLIDTMVRGNRLYGTGSGGGVAAGDVVSINTNFVDNRAFGTESSGRGGAISATSLAMVGGTFIGNGAGGDSYGTYGGAVSASTVDITNVVFTGNSVAAYPGEPLEGAALYVRDGGTLTNVTFVGNTGADVGKAVFAVEGALELRNCVVDNGDWLGSDTATVTATWSCIVGGYPGEGNIDADPMLDADYRLMAGSPAIDAGNTTLLPADAYDLDGDGDTSEPVPFDAAGLARAVDDPATPDTGVGAPVVDMGAYEVQGACRADLDGDGVLTLFDFLEFQNAFDAGDPIADFDGDGELTLFDFLAFQNEFDAGCA